VTARGRAFSSALGWWYCLRGDPPSFESQAFAPASWEEIELRLAALGLEPAGPWQPRPGLPAEVAARIRRVV